MTSSELYTLFIKNGRKSREIHPHSLSSLLSLSSGLFNIKKRKRETFSVSRNTKGEYLSLTIFDKGSPI